MARTRRRYSNSFVRSDAQAAVVDAAAPEKIPRRTSQQGGAKHIPTRLHSWSKSVAVVPSSGKGDHRWPCSQDPSTRSKNCPGAGSAVTPARGIPSWPEDILMEILSTVWHADLSPQERRAFLHSAPLVCKHWLQACARICFTSAYTVSARSDLFEPVSFKHLLGDPALDSITRTYTRQLPAPMSLPTSRHLEISLHLSLRYKDSGCIALTGLQRTAAGALPAPLLRDAIDTFRHLDYMPNLRSLVMEYRVHRDTDAAPLHRATFHVVHVDVEYHFFSHYNRDGGEGLSSHHPPTQHWIAEELGLLPTSVSRAVKREAMLNILPDLNLVSFTSPHASVDIAGPAVHQAIGDMISMGAGSVSGSKADDGRSIGVRVHRGLQGLLGTRFALVHGALDKNTCVVNYPPPAPQSRPLSRRRRQSVSFQFTTHNTIPPLPISVRGTALALVVNLGGVDSSSSDSNDLDIDGLREARIFSKRSSI